MTDDLIERVARAWASIDGKAETFDREKAIVYPNWEGDSGTYEGYMTEAEELLKRSGLTTLLATSAEKDAEIARLTEATGTWEWQWLQERDLKIQMLESRIKAEARAESAEAEAAALREHSHQRGEDIRKLSAEAAALRERLERALDFINRTGGTTLGLVMSGRDHPDPDGALMALSREAIDLSQDLYRALQNKEQANG